MLGWHISVFRQTDGGLLPAVADTATGKRLAVWQTGPYGLRWLEELIASGRATDLDGNGYPNRYTAQAQFLIPIIVAGPLEAHRRWVHEADDVILPGWEGKTVIDQATVDECRPDEWLLVVAWDES